jgi:murein DD-endopeptidase MepM/ murein hydrolase activator NlpD
MCCAALFVSGFILGLYRQGLFGSTAATAPSEQTVTGATVTVTSPGPAQATSGPIQAAPEPTAPPPTAEELLAGLKWPVPGRIAREPAWLYSEPLKEWIYLPGVDIAVEPDSPVRAAIRGAVKSVQSDAVLGTVLVLRHEGGLETTYGRIASTTKAPGDNVAQGEVIGTSGPDDVYFKITRDGEPLNPQDYLAKAK